MIASLNRIEVLCWFSSTVDEKAVRKSLQGLKCICESRRCRYCVKLRWRIYTGWHGLEALVFELE